MKYISSAEAAKKWGLSQRRVTLLCSEGRIKDAVKVGKTWILPESSTKPEDARRSQESDFSWDDCEVAETSFEYGAQAGLSIDPGLWRAAKIAVSRDGENLDTLVNSFLRQLVDRKGSPRIGAAEGVFTCCDDFDFCNDEISEMFGV